MSDNLVQRLRDLAEEWFEMCEDIHEPLYEAAERIEAQAVKIEWLRKEINRTYDKAYWAGVEDGKRAALEQSK
jgi:hypothetical protein